MPVELDEELPHEPYEGGGWYPKLEAAPGELDAKFNVKTIDMGTMEDLIENKIAPVLTEKFGKNKKLTTPPGHFAPTATEPELEIIIREKDTHREVVGTIGDR